MMVGGDNWPGNPVDVIKDLVNSETPWHGDIRILTQMMLDGALKNSKEMRKLGVIFMLMSSILRKNYQDSQSGMKPLQDRLDKTEHGGIMWSRLNRSMDAISKYSETDSKAIVRELSKSLEGMAEVYNKLLSLSNKKEKDEDDISNLVGEYYEAYKYLFKSLDTFIQKEKYILKPDGTSRRPVTAMRSAIRSMLESDDNSDH